MLVLEKSSFLTYFQYLIISSVVLCVLFIPSFTYAGTFYRCIDKGGNETLLDFPLEGQACTQIRTPEEISGRHSENKTVVSADYKITKIIVRGNQVLVPAILIYGSREVNVHLLLDTGATATAIHDEIAGQLYINLYKAKKAKGEVVGGAVIEASIIRMDILKIGPHTIRNMDIFIVPYNGASAKFDGLLGMDVLGKLSYKIDFAKQVIIWE
ncbi:MAG: TIGR02281 family clan AA aspartic protease [Smithellaceae bacterium]